MYVWRHWCNCTDREKPKQWEKNLSQCHFVHHKSIRDSLSYIQRR